MNQPKIDHLTPEQTTCLLSRKEQWQPFVLSTERINPQDAIQAMQAAYNLLGETQPEFVVCESPDAALKLASAQKLHLGRRIEKKLRKPLQNKLEAQLSEELIQDIYEKVSPEDSILAGQMDYPISQQLAFRKFIKPDYWLNISILVDVGTSILGCVCDRQRGEIVQSIFKTCGWILPYSDLCIICDRPTIIRFRSNTLIKKDS